MRAIPRHALGEIALLVDMAPFLSRLSHRRRRALWLMNQPGLKLNVNVVDDSKQSIAIILQKMFGRYL